MKISHQNSANELIFISASNHSEFDTIFFIVGGSGEERGWAQAEIRALLDDAGHRLTRCNVSLMTLLDLDSLSAMQLQQVCLFISLDQLVNDCLPT